MGLKEVQALQPLNFGPILIKSKEPLYLEDLGDSLILTYKDVSITILKTMLEKPYEQLFITQQDIDKAVTYGSEICLVTELGLRTYSVEGINFKNNSTTYVNLDLKAID